MAVLWTRYSAAFVSCCVYVTEAHWSCSAELFPVLRLLTLYKSVVLQTSELPGFFFLSAQRGMEHAQYTQYSPFTTVCIKLWELYIFFPYLLCDGTVNQEVLLQYESWRVCDPPANMLLCKTLKPPFPPGMWGSVISQHVEKCYGLAIVLWCFW